MDNWKKIKAKVMGLVTGADTFNHNNQGGGARQAQQPPIPSYTRLPPNRTNHFQPPPQLTKEEIDARIAQQTKEKQEETWLSSERNWAIRIGQGWIPKKVLGRGTEGIVGWWQYQSLNSSSSRGDPTFSGLKNVAVKQNVMNYQRTRDRGLKAEAWFYKFLEAAKSEHVPKMYRELYQDVGQGTMDGDRGDVERIFLEFCPGGDLQDMIDRRIDSDEPFSEKEIWEVFHCLARAAHVLRYQNIDGDKPQVNPDGKEIVHLDIKPGNVLIGESMTDGEHQDAPPYKLADFGFSKIVPDVQTKQFWYESWGGTPQGLPPEQVQDQYAWTPMSQKSGGERPWVVPDPYRPGKVRNTHPLGDERRYGSETNIWAISLMIWQMMRGYKDPPWDGHGAFGKCLEFIRWGNANSPLYGKGLSIGTLVDRQGDPHYRQVQYSEALWRCIFECLLYIPKNRPLVEDLMRRTREGMELARVFERNQGPAPDYTHFAEPHISDRWNSHSGGGGGGSGKDGGGGGKRASPSSRQVTAMRYRMDAAQVLETARRRKEQELKLMELAARGIDRLNFETQPGNRGVPASLIPGVSNRPESADEKHQRLRDEAARGAVQPGTRWENEQNGSRDQFHQKEQEVLTQQARNAKIDQDVEARRYKSAVDFNTLKHHLAAASAKGNDSAAASLQAQMRAHGRDDIRRRAIEDDEKVQRDSKVELALRNVQTDRQAAQASHSSSKRKSDIISREDVGHTSARDGITQGAVTQGVDDTQYRDPKRKKETQKYQGSQSRPPNQNNQAGRTNRNAPRRDRSSTSRMERDRLTSIAGETTRREKLDLAAAIKALDEFEMVERQLEQSDMTFYRTGREPSQVQPDHQLGPPASNVPASMPNLRVCVNEGSTLMVAERIYIMHLTTMRGDMSVLDVKKRIEWMARYSSIKADSMRLFVDGKELLNSKYLRDMRGAFGKEWMCLKA